MLRIHRVDLNPPSSLPSAKYKGIFDQFGFVGNESMGETEVGIVQFNGVLDVNTPSFGLDEKGTCCSCGQSPRFATLSVAVLLPESCHGHRA